MPAGSSGGYPDEDSVSVEFEADSAGSPGGFEDLLQRHGTELSPKLARRISDMVPKNMISFQFVACILTAGQSPPLVCTICGAEGHSANDCPDDRPVLCPPIDSPAPTHRNLLDRIVHEVMDEWQPHQHELIKRDEIVEDLREFITRSGH